MKTLVDFCSGDYIVNIAMKRGVSREDAEDLRQDLFEKLYNKENTTALESRGELEWYIRTCVKHYSFRTKKIFCDIDDIEIPADTREYLDIYNMLSETDEGLKLIEWIDTKPLLKRYIVTQDLKGSAEYCNQHPSRIYQLLGELRKKIKEYNWRD